MKEQMTVLLVEDDRVDAMTVRRAFRDLQITNSLDIVSDGEEALEYLRNNGHRRLGIILLDLNMPRMNGIEFLRIARQENALNGTPVVVLTTSREEQDKVGTFNLGVAGYMVKPVDYRQFLEVVRTIKLYWTLSELP
ncbi:MAG: response regulator [Chloroflexi bacterium]|nr:response regulator [Chloroflexota bacterium]